MAENNSLEQEKQVQIREYWEVFYKRRIVFSIVAVAVFLMGIFWAFFMVELEYEATAKAIIGLPPVTIRIRGDHRTVVRQSYNVIEEVEVLESQVIAERASELLKDEQKYGIEVPPDKIIQMADVTHRTKQDIKSNVIDLAARSTDAREAFLVLQAVIEAYTYEGEERRKEIIQKTYGAVSNALMAKRKELENAQKVLTKFVIENDIIARAIEVGEEIDSEGKIVMKKEWEGPQVNEKYLALKSQRLDKEAFLEEVKRHRDEDEIIALSIVAKKEEGMVDLTLRDELYEKERELSKLLLTQSELHPDVIEMKGEVEEAKKKISFELDRAIQSLEISIDTLRKEEEKLRDLIKEGLSEKMVEYTTLKIDVEAKKQLYDSFAAQLQVLNITRRLESIPFIKITQPPILPEEPVHSRPYYVVLAFMLAFMSGVGAILVLENLDISVVSVEDVEDIMGLTVLAAIPAYKKEADDEAVEGDRGRFDSGLVTVHRPKSIISEAFRTLRTNIKFVCVGKDIKSLIVTSAGPKEGKSFVASNLAVAIAGAGEKVILIDADLRRPVVHKYFNIDNSKGLSSLLVGERSIEDVETCSTEFENLKIIPSGPIPPNPNELLGTNIMEELLHKLRQDCDIVIIDSPPALTVSDSLILGAKTDGTILIFMANKTAKRAGSRLNLLLKNTGANILGGVLNKAEIGKKGGYYYYEYGHYNKEKGEE